jgi:hypothetical protein
MTLSCFQGLLFFHQIAAIDSTPMSLTETVRDFVISFIASSEMTKLSYSTIVHVWSFFVLFVVFLGVGISFDIC